MGLTLSSTRQAPLGRLTRREALAGGAAALALAGCSASNGSRPESTTGAGTAPTPGSVPRVVLDEATVRKLDDLLARGMTATGVPGASVGLWVGDSVWRRTVGVADLTTKEPYRADDLARIASITKTFTGTAVLQLVDAGKISLGSRLDSYVPGIANGGRITVENLLSMTSGIFDFTGDEAFLARFDADPAMAWSAGQTLAIIKAHQPAFEPGAKVVYCDSNYVLLGLIVEKVTGRPLGEVITSEIIGKLGLRHTSYPTTAEMPQPHPTAYLPDLTGVKDPHHPFPFDNTARPPTVANRVNPVVSAGAGAMISTVDDLKLWGQELARGTLLSRQTQERRLVTAPLAGQQLISYGLGVAKFGSMVGHNGAIIGYSALVLHYPAAGATVVAVSNEATNFTSAATDLGTSIAKALYPEAFVV